ncbi:hypothetical protein AB3N60_04345 [Leptospira sp. WS39.C2]
MQHLMFALPLRIESFISSQHFYFNITSRYFIKNFTSEQTSVSVRLGPFNGFDFVHKKSQPKGQLILNLQTIQILPGNNAGKIRARHLALILRKATGTPSRGRRALSLAQSIESIPLNRFVLVHKKSQPKGQLILNLQTIQILPGNNAGKIRARHLALILRQRPVLRVADGSRLKQSSTNKKSAHFRERSL